MKMRMVTRTIETCLVEALFVTIDGEYEKKLIAIPGPFKSPKYAVKKINAIKDNDEITCVHATLKETVSKKYGMSENDFMAYSVEIKEKEDGNKKED